MSDTLCSKCALRPRSALHPKHPSQYDPHGTMCRVCRNTEGGRARHRRAPKARRPAVTTGLCGFLGCTRGVPSYTDRTPVELRSHCSLHRAYLAGKARVREVELNGHPKYTAHERPAKCVLCRQQGPRREPSALGFWTLCSDCIRVSFKGAK